MLKRVRSFFKSKQKGQSMAIIAAAAPILCAFVGAAMDFGWLYINQSRLQNAADAAATAGAATLIADEMPLSDYSYTTFIANTDSGLVEMQEKNIISTRTKDQTTSVTKDNVTTVYPAAGDSIAKLYAEKNLQGWLGTDKTRLIATDEVGRDSQGYENIKFASTLYGQNNEDYAALYYTVTLSTKLEHLFGGIIEYFGFEKLPSVATAAVKISHVSEPRSQVVDSDYPHGPSLYDQMKAKEKSETYATWEDVKVAKNNNSTAANDRSVLTGGASYTSGNLNRIEMSILNGDAFSSNKSNPTVRSSTDQKLFDDLFIDFQGEMNKSMWQGIDVDLDVSKTSGNWDYGDALASNLQYSYRVHFPVCINIAYPIRTGKAAPDCLYAFIEQEPIVRKVIQSNGTSYNRGNMSSIRQIIISANVANTNTSTDRPIVFFYEGPEIATQEENSAVYDTDGDYKGVRPFLPVILNLNANFRGILFAPNNPVVINGNGYKFEGFVVGQSFKRLKTSSDFANTTYASGSDKGKPAYISFTYNGGKGYAGVKDWQELNSSSTSGYTSTKIEFNGVWLDGYIRNGQFYSRDENPDISQYARISDSSTSKRYAFFKDILLKTTLDGKNYVATYTGKFYVPVSEEKVTYTGKVSTVSITSGDGSQTVYTSSGKTITQKVNTMYISGTPYKYTATYLGSKTEKVKTRELTMAVGDVQFMDIGTVEQVKDADGNWTETPGDSTSFTDDDKVRYDYVSIFNLKSDSTYNSFLNVGLVNYTYLAKNEFGANTSHDMFFTTKRSKNID